MNGSFKKEFTRSFLSSILIHRFFLANALRILLALQHMVLHGHQSYVLTLFYFGGGGRGGVEMPYPSGFFKYLQNYLLNWLEICKLWFSNCFKTGLKKLLKIGVRKALNHALSWMTSYRKKCLKIFFSFFFNNFSLFVISMLCLLLKTIFFGNRC